MSIPKKSTTAHPIAYRLTEMIRMLNEGQKLAPQALSELFGIPIRTIQRDLNERLAFLELIKADGCYSLGSLRLGTLTLKDVERFATLAGLQGLHPRLSNDFLRDILASRIQQTTLIHGHNYEDNSQKEPLFVQLRGAIEGFQCVGFEYTKPDSAKIVEGVQPYRLINKDGVWYLAAVDGGKLKAYSISRLSRLLVSNERFLPDPLITKAVNQEDSIWLSLNKTEVVLKIAPPAAEYFQRRKLIGGQKIVKELEDGGLIVSGLIAHPNQILPIVRYWLPCIHVISPEGIQAELERQMRSYLGLP